MSDPVEVTLYKIVIDYLAKYWPRLDLAGQGPSFGCPPVRTTNDIETDWGTAKQEIRKAHGRARLTRDFHVMPEELMLTLNLTNPVYVRSHGTVVQRARPTPSIPQRPGS